MEHEYYIDRVNEVLKGTNYHKRAELYVSLNMFERIVDDVIYNQYFDVEMADHFVDLMGDAIRMVNGEGIYEYEPDDFGMLELYSGPLEEKKSKILEKEDVQHFNDKKAKNLIPALLRMIGLDDFTTDMDKRIILDRIEDILILSYNEYMNLE